jgi:hypothetical protein
MITPTVWADSSSERVKSVLYGLAGELKVGAGAMNDAADALDHLAAYVKTKRSTYESVGRQLADLPHTVPAGGDYMTALLHLNGQRQSIERDVAAAMAEAAATINSSAAKASRYQYKAPGSMWSHIEGFAHGLWDGTEGTVVGIGKMLLASAEVQAKLSPARAILDHRGFERDLKHFSNSIEGFVSSTASHPGQFISSLLNLDELKKDPARWAGALVPNIVLAVLTDGGGEAAEGVNLTSGGAYKASLSGVADIGRTALIGNPLDHIFETNEWMLGGQDFNLDGAVMQFNDESCVSASGEMLTNGSVSQADLYSAIGPRASADALAGILKRAGLRFEAVQFDSVSDVLDFLQDGPIGAALLHIDQVNGGFDLERDGHMVVIEQAVPGSYLVRDPISIGDSASTGITYKVDVNWLQFWVKSGVVQ